MTEIVHVANKVKATVHSNCQFKEPGNVQSEMVCEYLVYLAVPKMGGDGLLLGVTETSEAADAIASALNSIFGMVHTHA
jgi:hypothetical protein